MKLWLLRPREDLPDNDNPWRVWYDKCFGMVVRAQTEESAREIAHGHPSSRRYQSEPWNDAHYTSCIELTADGEPEVIIEDEHWA